MFDKKEIDVNVDDAASFDDYPPPYSSSKAPLKTYNMTRRNIWTKTSGTIDITSNGTPVYAVTTEASLFKSPLLQIHEGNDTGLVLAACKTSYWSQKLRVHLGSDCSNPDATDWLEISNDKWASTSFSFPSSASGANDLTWKATHNKDLGASRMSSKDFKLVAADDQRVIAAFIWHRGWRKSSWNIYGRLDVYEQLGEEAELLALAVLLGRIDYVRRSEQASATASAGGGGA